MPRTRIMSEPIATGGKICNHCGRRLSIGSFFRNPTSRGGLFNQCRDCMYAIKIAREASTGVTEHTRSRPGRQARDVGYEARLREWDNRLPSRARQIARLPESKRTAILHSVILS